MKPVSPDFSREKISDMKVFTDRLDARQIFSDTLKECSGHPDELNIISYYGIGGCGKSRLLEELKKSAGEKSYIYAGYDFENGSDKLLVIDRLTRQLTKKGLSFPLTRAAEIAYNQKIGVPIYVVKKKDLLDDPMLGIMADFIPGLSTALDYIGKGKEIYSILKEYYQNVCVLWDNDKEALDTKLKQISEMEDYHLLQYLPEYFRIDLQHNIRAFANKRKTLPVIIFLDSFENCVNTYQTDSIYEAADAWLRNDIIKRVPGILWVVAGREKSDWPEKDAFFAEIRECGLSDFGIEDTVSYLTKAKIPSSLHYYLFRLTGGVPLLLDISVDTYYECKKRNGAVSLQDFGNTSEDLIKRFFKYMDEADRQLAIFLCYLVKWIDEDVRRYAKGVLGPGFEFANYISFLRHTIIIKDKEQRYYIHENVRRIIQEAAKAARYSEIVSKTLEAVKERLWLTENSEADTVAESQADLQVMKDKGILGKDDARSVEEQNALFYKRYKNRKLGGWGPGRETFTMKKPARYPTFNSITDDPVLRDHRDFARFAKTGDKAWVNKLYVNADDVFQMYVHFSNEATPSLEEQGTAHGSRLSIRYPRFTTANNPAVFSAVLRAENTNPPAVWYMPVLWSDEDLEIVYIQGSANLRAFTRKVGYANNVPLPDALFSEEGTMIGIKEMDGDIPCIDDLYSGRVTARFLCRKLRYDEGNHWGPLRTAYHFEERPHFPVLNSIINNPEYGDERHFLKIDGYEDRHVIRLEPNRKYTVNIFYCNDAAENMNVSGKGLADKVKINVQLPDSIKEENAEILHAGIHAANAVDVWDQLVLYSNWDVQIRYVMASAKIINSGKLNGTVLSTELFTTGDYIGFNRLSGILPAGEAYGGKITFQFVVEKKLRTSSD